MLLMMHQPRLHEPWRLVSCNPLVIIHSQQDPVALDSLQCGMHQRMALTGTSLSSWIKTPSSHWLIKHVSAFAP